jgi:hypothetical protein
MLKFNFIEGGDGRRNEEEEFVEGRRKRRKWKRR